MSDMGQRPPSHGSIRTRERALDGESEATRDGNARAELVTGSTVAPTSSESYEEWKRRRGYITKDGGYTRASSPTSWESEEVVRGHYDYMRNNPSRPMSFTQAGTGQQGEIKAYEPDLQGRIWNRIYDGLSALGASRRTSQFYADRLAGHSNNMGLAEIAPVVGDSISIDEAKQAFGRGEYGTGIFYLATAIPIVGKLGKGARAARAGNAGGQAAAREGAEAAARSADAVPVGEPVSVVNGEYLETWRDFRIPGTFAFDGARYMGLKLDLPGDYVSPLGSCQISMFDEIFTNPKRGKLLFHDAGGRRIPFDRPFNFLPSVNAGHPNLELKAPWLKQLTLKDGPVTRSFRQYGDGVYRLEKIADLNGFELRLIRDENGALQRAEGPDGLALAFENAARGHRVRISLIGIDGTELELARYSYDGKGRMTGADCSHGVSVRYQWQADRDLLASWHDVSRASVTQFSYDEDGRVFHTATNGIWNDDRFHYDDGETIYLPGGREINAQRFRYDENRNVTAEIDPLGGMVEHRYDRAGFRIATKNANGGETRTRYDAHGHVGEAVDAEGRSTVYVWGDDGELHTVIDGAGNRRSYEHDFQSNVIAETDAEGHTTRLSRDGRGRVVATEFANGSIERREWDEHNRLVAVTDAKGHTTAFEYDIFNRLVATTDPLGHVTRCEYHAGAGGFDTPSRMIRPDGVAASRSFDEQGQLASVADGEGRRWTYRSGAFGVLRSITDPKGGTLSFDYDIEGRIVVVTNAVGCFYRYGRDAAGRVVEEEDFDGRMTRYRRDASGQVVETTRPNGARLTYDYDRSGLVRRIESFDKDGQPEDVTRFWYDRRGLLVRAENRAALVEFERDRNGRIVGETQNGKRIKSRRDAMGSRVVREITGVGSGLVEYVRDPLGLVERMVIGETEISFRHDALGRETHRQVGDFALAQRYDAADQLVAQVGGAKNAADIGVSRLGWNVPSGEGTPRRPSTVSRVYEYDRAFAPVRIDDGLWGEQRFDYDDNGQLVASEGARGSERFTYDPARNVAGASSSAPFSTESAGYGPAFDAAFGTVTPSGNPAPWRRTPGGVVQIARGPKGERLQLLHDECGRLIDRRVDRDGFRPQRWRYRWNAQDRLVGVIRADGEEWLFRYDPFGRRVSKVRRFAEGEREQVARRWSNLVGDDGKPKQIGPAPTDGGSLDHPSVGTAFLWDGAHMVAEAPLRLDGHVEWESATGWHFEGGESDDHAATHRLLAKERSLGTLDDGPREFGAAPNDDTSAARTAIFAVVCDHLGTPKEMFDVGGHVMWALDHHVWGAVRTVRRTGANGLAIHGSSTRAQSPLLDGGIVVDECPWRFPGQYDDHETGLLYNRYRYYDPVASQYATPDPIGLHGGDRPFGYVLNSNRWIDPLGLRALAPGQQGYRRTWGPHEEGPLGNPNIPDSVAATFRSGSYTERVLSEPIIVYRAHGGTAYPVGQYMTTVRPQGPTQAIVDSALDPAWGNTATQVHQFTIPAGTTIYQGVTAPQIINGGAGSLMGGGPQIFVPRSTLRNLGLMP